MYWAFQELAPGPSLYFISGDLETEEIVNKVKFHVGTL